METDTREVAPTCTACGSEHNGEGAFCFSCKPTGVPVCSWCEKAPAFNRVNGECLECFASGLAHGGEYSSIKALTAFIDDCQTSNGDAPLTRKEREAVARVARTYGYGRKQ